MIFPSTSDISFAFRWLSIAAHARLQECSTRRVANGEETRAVRFVPFARSSVLPPEAPGLTSVRMNALVDLDSLLEDVAARAQAARPRVLEDLTNAQTLALGLFVAAFEVFRGIRALLRDSLAEEARMLSRTLLDDTARLIWLARVRDDPEELEARTLRFLFDSLEYEGHLMRAARENGFEWAEDESRRVAEEQALVIADAKRRRLTLKRMPKPVDLLTSLGQRQLYYWHVRASQSLHSSRVGFSARFRPAPAPDGSVTITLESPVDEVVRVGVMAIQTFSLALIAAADVMGWQGREDLVDYRERVIRLSNDLFEVSRDEKPF
jgi:hypothetical protein